MHKVYDKWPEIAKLAYNREVDALESKNIDHIVFAGMGGSGSIGDLFSAVLSKTNIHVSVVKGYVLPKTVQKNTLVVTTSVSGNTAETISALNYAQKLDSQIVAFSSGGKIEKFCFANKINHININQFHSPRASFPNYLYVILNVLKNIIPTTKEEVLDSINQMRILSREISSENLNEDNQSLRLALWLKDIPAIYYPFGLKAAAIRFKNSMQENAKRHAIAEDVIEACHNGVVAWEKPTSVQPVLLKGHHDHSTTKERWNILKEFFAKKEIQYQEIMTVDGNILSKIINLIYLLDYTSIYCALISKIDPSPVNAIEFIKSRLG